MRWIYLSPHLDDAVYSCGGIIWEQVQRGELIEIWTVCAGDPPDAPLSQFAQSLHLRWGTGPEAIAVRRDEDRCACRSLGVKYQHLQLPDCIYRRDPESGKALYASEEAIFGPVHPAERELVNTLVGQIFGSLVKDDILVSPMVLGGHVDHRLVDEIAVGISGYQHYYYADYPYVIETPDVITSKADQGWEPLSIPLSSAAVEAWVRGAACHQSQISTFWAGKDELRSAFTKYAGQPFANTLWRRCRVQPEFY